MYSWLSKILKAFCFIVATNLILFPSSFLYGQINLPHWEVGLSSTAGGGKKIPFWIVSNRQGKYFPGKNSVAIELGIYAQGDSSRVFNYDYGLELYSRYSSSSEFWLHQAYAGVIFSDLVQFRAGLWEETVGSKEPTLSSGSVIWSGNARPMPRIQIGTPGYVDVPFSEGYLEIKGLMDHGWFENNRFASGVMLHHKNAYLRLGGRLPVNIYYGFNHYAQWGGSSPRQEEPYPSDIKSFMRVFFNIDGDPDRSGTPEGWVINRFGNHLGSRNYGIDLNLKYLSAGIYLQDIFEDNSGISRKNFPDGLWGLWIRFTNEKKPVQAFVYEFFHSTNQSGPYHDIDGDTLGGNDNYFNHGHYQSGWTYHKYTIGTPLITSPVLENTSSFKISNNRVIAHHIGFEGFISSTSHYRSFLTFSRNFGTYSKPFEYRKDQFSLMLELTNNIKLFDLKASVTLAADLGEMHGDNYGILFTVRKRGNFFR